LHTAPTTTQTLLLRKVNDNIDNQQQTKGLSAPFAMVSSKKKKKNAEQHVQENNAPIESSNGGEIEHAQAEHEKLNEWSSEITDKLDHALVTHTEELSKRLDVSVERINTRTIQAERDIRRVIDKLSNNTVLDPSTSSSTVIVDPQVQIMFQNFVQKMDEMAQERDTALSNRMNRVTGSLSKLTQYVKIMEDKKHDTSQQTNVQQQLEQEKLKVAEKVTELETLQKKVADWKDKVKQITSRDMQTIQQLKKQVKEREDQIQQLQTTVPKASEEQPPVQQEQEQPQEQQQEQQQEQPQEQPQEQQLQQSNQDDLDQLKNEVQQLRQQLAEKESNQAAVPQETNEADQESAQPQMVKDDFTVEQVIHVGQDICHCLLRFTDGTIRWIDQQELQTLFPDKSIIFPPNITETLETAKRDLVAKEEELRTYKTRAHAALKKKTESVTKIQVQAENKLAALQLEYNQLDEKHKELRAHEVELELQVQELINVQTESVRMADEIDQLQSQKSDIEDKLRLCQENLNDLELKYQSDTASLKQEMEQMTQKHAEKIYELESQSRKELQAHRERTRRMMDEKEREIAKLQMKLTSQKREQLAQIEQIKADKERELNEQILQQQQPITSSEQSSHEQFEVPVPSSPVIEHKPMLDETEILKSALSPTTAEPPPLPQSSITISANEGEQTFDSESAEQDPEFDKFMHLAQLQASRDGELMQYKKTINELQVLLQDKEHAMKSFKDLEVQLRREIEHLQALYQHGTPNLEYLKNVLLKMLETKDLVVRERLFKVVATILDFTTNEQNRIIQQWAISASSSSTTGIFSLFNRPT
jgi:chromosome segregation ATPase